MSDMFEGKVALVTGAASGFGLGICKRLLLEGAKAVGITDYIQRDLDLAARELEAEYPGRVFSMLVDVGEKGAIEKAIENAAADSGRLDFLFNNAGRPMTKPALDIEPEDFRRLIDVNYVGVVMGTLAALKVMEGQGGGYVVNAASLAGLVPAPFQCAYASTKAAVIAFTRSLAYEYADTDIHFSQYAPANVATSIFSAEYSESLRKKGLSEEEIAEKIKDVKPPKGAVPLEKALDILFEGIENYRTDIPVGDDALFLDEMFCKDRKAFEKTVLELGAKRRAFYRTVRELESRGESAAGVPFPG